MSNFEMDVSDSFELDKEILDLEKELNISDKLLKEDTLNFDDLTGISFDKFEKNKLEFLDHENIIKNESVHEDEFLSISSNNSLNIDNKQNDTFITDVGYEISNENIAKIYEYLTADKNEEMTLIKRLNKIEEALDEIIKKNQKQFCYFY